MGAKGIRDLMLEDLARSGLDEKDARLMKLEPLTREETARVLGPQWKHLGYRIPYFNLDGTANEFWRIRFLEPVHAFGSGKKVTRYRQPADSQPYAYFPPYVDWLAIATDPSRTVVITEGEKKAAKACREGVPCIGLGGVFNFASEPNEIDFLTELDIWVWEGRNVEIAFDA